MELIEELAAQARNVLVPGGMLFLEFGYDQGDAVPQCLNKHKGTKLTKNRVPGHFYFKDFEPEQAFKKGSCPTVETQRPRRVPSEQFRVTEKATRASLLRFILHRNEV